MLRSAWISEDVVVFRNETTAELNELPILLIL